VDDFEPFRRFVSLALENRSDLQIAAEASDGLDAVRMAEDLHPDLILLDIGLPRLNGIEAARRIRRLSPESKIVFLTQESSPEIRQEALKAGACGYVVKENAGCDLLTAMDSALRLR
jgi:DNA-binding NarL/FixJ family response regulator